MGKALAFLSLTIISNPKPSIFSPIFMEINYTNAITVNVVTILESYVTIFAVIVAIFA
ncbi:MAG: hypothetical protein GZ087_12705 [Flavobacterium sp.]|nr:hypothetical protein [Flavobacterium sp.]